MFLEVKRSKRLFDYRVIVTNPTAITEIEEKKKNEVFKLTTVSCRPISR